MAIIAKHRAFRAGLLSAAAWVGAAAIAEPAIAQETQTSQAERVIDLPAGPLGPSILALSDAFGIQVLAPNTLVAGKRSGPVSGSLAVDEALDQLLATTDLKATRIPNGNYVIEADRSERQGNAGPFLPLVSDEIIVTGTKSNLTLQETSTSVSVFTREAIEEQVLIDIEDILLRAPNVSTSGIGTLNALSIRGVSLGGVGGSGTGATVNVYVDGAPNSFTSNQSAANLWDVAQVEVLRGPQSTVQGRNALGGAVIVRTADPEYDFGVDARVRAGNEEQRQYSGAVTGPIVDNQLAFRLAADYREIDFGVLNTTDGSSRSRFQEALTLRGKLLFEPEAIDGLRVKLTGSYVDTEFGDFNTVFASDPVATVTDNVPSFIPGVFDDFDIFGTETSGQGGIARFEANEVWRTIVDVEYAVSDNWTINALGSFEDVERETTFGVADSLTDGETYQAELRANFDYGRLSGWVGAYYFEEETVSQAIITGSPEDFFIPTSPRGGIVQTNSTSTTTTENYAFFGDLTYALNERWEVNVGARLDFEDFSDTGQVGTVTQDPPDCIIDPNVPLPFAGLPCAAIFPVQNSDPISADFSAFLPRGSITYNFDEDRSLAFIVARGYRAGGAFIRNVVSDTGQITGFSQEQFDPEYLTNFELAFRSLWLDERLRVNANVFYSDWEDQQVTVVGPSGFFDDFDIENAGQSTLYGAEFDIAMRVTPDLDLFASLGLVETEFDDFPFVRSVSPDGDPQFANLDGNAFNSAPNVTAAVGFAYEHPSGFFLTSNAAYTGRQYSDVENFDIEKADDFVLVNGRFGYRHEFFDISLFANNLFDDRFVTSQNIVNVNTNTGVVDPIGNPRFVVNDPRLWGIEMRVSF
ncbi:MAG: TonB-dependent receptor [Pseudomonadota bacterium]